MAAGGSVEGPLLEALPGQFRCTPAYKTDAPRYTEWVKQLDLVHVCSYRWEWGPRPISFPPPTFLAFHSHPLDYCAIMCDHIELHPVAPPTQYQWSRVQYSEGCRRLYSYVQEY